MYKEQSPLELTIRTLDVDYTADVFTKMLRVYGRTIQPRT